MIYCFNTDYVLWHDEKRTFIIQRYENNDSTRGWISIVHPVHAMMFSFFSQQKEFEDALRELADFLNTTTESAHKLIAPFIQNKEPFTTGYGGDIFHFPKNILLEVSANNMQQQRNYKVEDFERAMWFARLDTEQLQEGNPCKTCGLFDGCYKNMNRCWAEVMKAYGDEFWDYPDPRCEFAPPYKVNHLKY